MASSMRVVDTYRALVEGLTVNSEFDQWPIRRGAGAAAAAAGGAGGPASRSGSSDTGRR